MTLRFLILAIPNSLSLTCFSDLDNLELILCFPFPSFLRFERIFLKYLILRIRLEIRFLRFFLRLDLLSFCIIYKVKQV